MVIEDVLTQLKEAVNPVAKVLHRGENFKALIIGFKKGMILKEHKTNLASKLIVLSGKVIYKAAGQEFALTQYMETEIPVNILHSVEAEEDSLCLLTQG